MNAYASASISWKLSNTMVACKMFQSVLTYYQFLGYYSPHSNQIHTSRLRILFFSTFSMLFFSSLLGFFLFEAKTIQVNITFGTFVLFSYIYLTDTFATLGFWQELLCSDISCLLHVFFIRNVSANDANPKNDQTFRQFHWKKYALPKF